MLLTSCGGFFTEKEMYGYYVPIGYKNTFDTIELRSHGFYHRKVYNKNKELALEMDGKWEIEREEIIRFHSFFFNLDRDIEKFPELIKDTVDDGGGWIGREKNIIQFCVGYDVSSNCYRKIK